MDKNTFNSCFIQGVPLFGAPRFFTRNIFTAPFNNPKVRVYPLSTDMKMQILLTVLYTFLYRTSKGNFSKYQYILSLVITSSFSSLECLNKK